MDDRVGWIADGIAASLLGAAIGACLLMLGHPQLAVGCASAAVSLALVTLRMVKPEPRRFHLPAFTLPAADDVFANSETPNVALPPIEEEEDNALLLDQPIPPEVDDGSVVQLFAPRDSFTPIELRRRIEAHLAASDPNREPAAVHDLEVDAAAALRDALGELRRSLA